MTAWVKVPPGLQACLDWWDAFELSTSDNNNNINNNNNNNNNNNDNNNNNRCSPAQLQGPGCHRATARVKWNKEVNKVVMESFYRIKSFDDEGKPIRGYRRRMFREWRERGMFKSTGHRVCDQPRAIRKNGWILKVELGAIEIQIEDESPGELCREQDVAVEALTVETDIGTVEEEIYDLEDSILDTEGDLSEEYQTIVEQLEERMVEGRTGNGIMFKIVDKKVLKVQADRVNEVIQYLESKSITETNNLTRAASAWVAEWTELKKAEHEKKNEPKWKLGLR